MKFTLACRFGMKEVVFPPVAKHTAEVSFVKAVDGNFIPEGRYQLKTEDGEYIHVKNLGIAWSVLSGA